MPAKSEEAMKKKKARRQARRWVQRKVLTKSDLPAYKIAARRMLPRLPAMSKAELREMLAQAAANTK